MGITECANGHIYDTDYYDVCPYCNRNSERSKGTGLLCPFCMAKNEAEAEICKVCGRPIKSSNGVHELPVGTLLFNRYYVGKTMRQGGFGITYVGCDIKLDKKIAIKEYFPQGMVNRLSSHSCEVVSVDNSKDIFERERVKSINEARILAEFAGEPNIVSVTDVLSENGTVYIVMEYVEGTDLDEYLRSNPKMSFQEAFLMIYPVICALQKVHEKGLIHRDISPSNIKITLNGIPVLLDFGAAREYSTEVEKSLSVILKPGYAPPEQFSSHGKQGPFTDVYAISATIYYMITGITPQSALERVVFDELKKPSDLAADITPAEEQILMSGLEIDQSKRIQSMKELSEKMNEAIKKTRGNNNVVYQGKKKSRKVFWIALAIILIFASGLYYSVIKNSNLNYSEVNQHENISQTGDLVETGNTDEGETALNNTGKIITGSDVILVGDTTNIKFGSNGMEYITLDGINYESSDESIAYVDYDDESGQVLIKGVSVGTATIRGTRGNEFAEKEMIVATVDNSYGANISCDVGELLLISDDPRGVTFHIQIEGKIPSKLMANAYNSKGLDLSVEGGFENNILSLTVRDVASKKDSGTFRVLMSDGDDPSHVIGEITLPVMIRF